MSTNPISPGTYTFQKYGVDGKDCIANCTSTTYRRVANNYTGTVAYVDGGSVKIETDKVTFDLYATTSDGSKRLHYTGTLASTFYYVQDKRESQSHLKAAAWLSGFLYKSDHETFDGIYNVNW